VIPYNLEFSSLRKIYLSIGKVRQQGNNASINAPYARKNKKPFLLLTSITFPGSSLPSINIVVRILEELWMLKKFFYQGVSEKQFQGRELGTYPVRIWLLREWGFSFKYLLIFS